MENECIQEQNEELAESGQVSQEKFILPKASHNSDIQEAEGEEETTNNNQTYEIETDEAQKNNLRNIDESIAVEVPSDQF